MKKLMALLAVAALFCCNVNAQTPVLNIEGGQVQGVTTDINGVIVYRGIPYAASFPLSS